MSARIVPIPAELDANVLRSFTDTVKQAVTNPILKATLGLVYQDFEYVLKTTLTDRPNVSSTTERTLTISLNAYTSSHDQWSRLVNHLRQDLAVEAFEKLYGVKVAFKLTPATTSFTIRADAASVGTALLVNGR